LQNDVKQNTIKEWIRKKREDNPDIEVNQSGMPTSDENELQKALRASQLKVLALETLIDVAEQEFKIKIRKKPGAKQ
jgi:transposase